MWRSLTDPLVLLAITAAGGLLGAAIRAIVRQARTRYVTADSLITPPVPKFTGCEPALREEAARRRARVEELQRRARRASAGATVPAEIVPMRSRRVPS